VRPFATSKNLRDAQSGVRIEFLVSGGYPGDGKPKPVSFPTPAKIAVEIGGIKYVHLPVFIELKLASGMTGQNREIDLVDVSELIAALQLPQALADQLNPFVRDEYLRRWQKVHAVSKRFILDRQLAGDQLQEMLDQGVILEGEGEHARLVTTNPLLARKYGMDDESELLS
jgi:hypothetical protein